MNWSPGPRAALEAPDQLVHNDAEEHPGQDSRENTNIRSLMSKASSAEIARI